MIIMSSTENLSFAYDEMEEEYSLIPRPSVRAMFLRATFDPRGLGRNSVHGRN